MHSRFATTTQLEAENKLDNLNAKNTKRATKNAAKILQEYLIEKKLSGKFESLPDAELNDLLAQFYFDLRKIDGQKYKVSSLEGLRYGLNRHLQSAHRNIDITY